MTLSGKVAVITGAAGGIGAALARRFVAEGARGVVLGDIRDGPLREIAEETGGRAVICDARREDHIRRLVAEAEAAFGPVEVFVSNAGVSLRGDETAPDADWQRCWELHVMAHVYAARAVAPRMAERGSGYLLNVASAAGLLTHTNSATYAVTKHAAVAFAEWLSIAYGDRGVRVSVLCPQAVRTEMIRGREQGVAGVDGVIEPEDAAEAVIRGMAREDFLILPHPTVLDYLRRKTADYGRWLAGMRKLRAKYLSDT